MSIRGRSSIFTVQIKAAVGNIAAFLLGFFIMLTLLYVAFDLRDLIHPPQ